MDAPQLAKPLTPEDEFYLEWGRETQKASISTTLDTLQRLISLNGTMLGGSLLLWQTLSSPSWMKPACCILLLLSLLAAFWGALPSSQDVDPDDPAAIKKFKERLLSRRNTWVRVSAGLTSLAFILALIALAIATISSTQAKPTDKKEGANNGAAGQREGRLLSYQSPP